jgi:hypothetical protein
LALARAEWERFVLTTYPGYTLATLRSEDAHALMQHFALLDPDIGKAE